MNTFKISPWFPWNGSKRWLLKDLAAVFEKWDGKGNYIEPFVGGGSVSAMVSQMFPGVRHYLSDANPWLIGAYESQLIPGDKLLENFSDIEYWRGLKDSDLAELSVLEKANRFAVCLFTAWGNRWKARNDGSMGTENPVNYKFAKIDFLKPRLSTFFETIWLKENDIIRCCDWKDSVVNAKPGDLVYLDPPYPESLGYGNQWWSFSDQLDIVDWTAEAIEKGISVVVSNMSTIERLYKRLGMKTIILSGPRISKTRRSREEVIAYKITV